MNDKRIIIEAPKMPQHDERPETSDWLAYRLGITELAANRLREHLEALPNYRRQAVFEILREDKARQQWKMREIWL